MIRMNNKGSSLFKWVLGAGSILIIIGLLAFVLATLQSTDIVCDGSYVYNESAGNCYLESNTSDTTAVNSVGSIYNNTLTMFTNFTGQLGTVGTLAGVFLIFALMGLAGFGVWMGYRKGRGGGII